MDSLAVTKTLWALTTPQIISPTDCRPTALNIQIHLDDTGLLKRCHWAQEGSQPVQEGHDVQPDAALGQVLQSWANQ